jgi:hypothetical protein
VLIASSIHFTSPLNQLPREEHKNQEHHVKPFIPVVLIDSDRHWQRLNMGHYIFVVFSRQDQIILISIVIVIIIVVAADIQGVSVV